MSIKESLIQITFKSMQDIPNLMPHQLSPFNDDHHIQQEFLKLKERFNLSTAIETGSALGGTTVFLGQNFERTFTIEINKAWLKIAIKRFDAHGVSEKIKAYLGSSEKVLDEIIQLYSLDSSFILYCDAHWNGYCPLHDELKVVAKHNLKPIIAIHDFQVPNEPNLGFDSYYGQPFTYEWIKPRLEEIYGVDGYDYYFNSDATSTAIKRGIIFITPKQ